MKNPEITFKVATLGVTVAAVLLIAMQVLAPGNKKGGPQKGNQQDPQNNVITVTTVTLEPTSIENTIKINGDIASKSEVTVYPDTTGKITRIEITEGTYVEKGTVLMYVDPSKPGSSYAASPVKSPVSGTVTEIPVTVGATITTNGTAAVIGSLDDLEITVSVAEKYSAYLKPNKKAYITIQSLPDTEFHARVTSVSPVVNRTTRTFTVKLEFDSYDNRIKPGMFCAVRLVLQQADQTMVLPKTSLTTYNAEPVVYIVDNENIARRRKITCGMENDEQVQIIDGLSAGETVITAGSVTDGSAVRFAQQ